ncbi:Uma2 family endonuclease [Synechococcales cyanobacterium C]|uniref:Uma2 family endonuclease n=2 Tax=Petrachloros TaxID=2918834 RepID=A0A8K2A7I0_9CYAN|nr:Uma2 family endonuclease [Petrachloros mirabilis ULC683]
MIASRDRIQLTAAAYLDWEAQQPIKYEYLNGEAYAMTGGTLAHNDIAVNLTTLLKNYLRGKPCKVRMADAKVGVTEQGPFFYPDVLVTCDRRDRTAKTIVQHPCLIIEVLSPGTEGYDRGEKFKHYRKLESLQEYVLVSSVNQNVEIYRLNAQNKWELTPYSADEVGTSRPVEFTSLDFQGAIADIYEDVEFVPESSDSMTEIL